MSSSSPIRVGQTQILSATPTVSATPDYTSGDLMGGKIELTVANHVAGVIQSVVITDLASQSLQIDVVFFKSDPSNTTFTDNAAFDVADADLPEVVGVASVTTWAAFNDNAVGTAANVGLPFDLGSSNILYAALVARGAHNLASTSDITLNVGILGD